jgi:hypothetical protein
MHPSSVSLTVFALAFTVTAPLAQAGHDDHDRYTVVQIVLPADPDCLPGFWDVTQAGAVIWEGTRAVDLNSLVPKRFAREFRLSIGATINDRGQIVARGIRRGEPKMLCPQREWDAATGQEVYNASLTCQNEYAFLLTPKRAEP